METKEQLNITERVKTFEDAMAITGRPPVPNFSNVPGDMREYFENQYKAVVITEALNEGWKADFEDSNQRKWFSWFYRVSSGFVFNSAYYYCSSADAGSAARLCFKSKELAEYAGKQFLDIYVKIITK